jgi:hypothetical protein
VLAVPANLVLHVAKTGTLRDPPAVRAACGAAGLAGADAQRHLLWRYSLVWCKQG